MSKYVDQHLIDAGEAAGSIVQVILAKRKPAAILTVGLEDETP